MSNPSKAIHYLLANDAAVSSVVGDRIYQMRILQGEVYPSIMIQKISDIPYSDKDGNDTFRARIQVNCYSESHAESNELAGYVMDALDRQLGNINGILVKGIDVLNEMETMENFAEFEGIFRVMQDFAIIYDRTYGS